MATQNPEKKGRKGDTLLGHLTPGEIVIPRALAEDEDLRKMLSILLRENGASLQQYMVGGTKNKRNPETGYLEFSFFSDIWGKVTKTAKDVFSGKVMKDVFSGIGDLLTGSDDIKMPTAKAEQPTRTAQALPQPSAGKGISGSKRAGAAFLAEEWNKPKLGKASILGW